MHQLVRLEKQLEKHHHEAADPAHAMQTMADGLPALGIVAAVLGVIKTMGAIESPPAVLGGYIGGALVGTFLGVFIAYGFVGPFAWCSLQDAAQLLRAGDRTGRNSRRSGLIQKGSNRVPGAGSKDLAPLFLCNRSLSRGWQFRKLGLEERHENQGQRNSDRAGAGQCLALSLAEPLGGQDVYGPSCRTG